MKFNFKKPVLCAIVGGLIAIAILFAYWGLDVPAGVALGGLIGISRDLAKSEREANAQS